jgi:pentatricopeptide repeat protein
MRTDGLEASTVVLNSLINAFGEDRRVVEAFSVLQFMKENVSDDLPLFCYLDLHHITSLVYRHLRNSSRSHKSLICFARDMPGF